MKGDDFLKIVSKEIDIITLFDKGGNIKPIKFKLEDENGNTKVIKVDNILDSVSSNFAGESIIIYKCQSYIDNCIKRFEIKYEKRTCKWYLYKI